MATLLVEFANTTSVDLNKRVQMAICNAALQISGETPALPASQEALRQRLATLVLQNPGQYTPVFTCAGCTVTGGEISDASTDAAIEASVSSVWNDVAGAI